MRTRTDTMYQEIRRLHSGLLPVGWLLQLLSSISREEATQDALTEAAEVLETSGLVVLDAHRDRIDILMTIVALAKQLHPNQLLGPAAGMYTDSPFFKKLLFQPVKEQMKTLEVFPIYRPEEVGKNNRHSVDRSGLTMKEKRHSNRIYQQKAENFVQDPGNVAVVATYGSRKTFGDKVRSGVAKLLRTETPAMLSSAQFDPKTMTYVVRLSQPMTFNKDMDNTEISTLVREEFSRLIR